MFLQHSDESVTVMCPGDISLTFLRALKADVASLKSILILKSDLEYLKTVKTMTLLWDIVTGVS